jgi:hypothetical protein
MESSLKRAGRDAASDPSGWLLEEGVLWRVAPGIGAEREHIAVGRPENRVRGRLETGAVEGGRSAA